MFAPRASWWWRLLDALRLGRRRRRQEDVALAYGFLLARYDLECAAENLRRWVKMHPVEFSGPVPGAEIDRAVMLFHERHPDLWRELREWATYLK